MYNFISIIKVHIYISENHIAYSKVVNEDCGIFHDMSISTMELYIKTENIDNTPVRSTPSLKVDFGNDKIYLC